MTRCNAEMAHNLLDLIFRNCFVFVNNNRRLEGFIGVHPLSTISAGAAAADGVSRNSGVNNIKYVVAAVRASPRRVSQVSPVGSPD